MSLLPHGDYNETISYGMHDGLTNSLATHGDDVYIGSSRGVFKLDMSSRESVRIYCEWGNVVFVYKNYLFIGVDGPETRVVNIETGCVERTLQSSVHDWVTAIAAVGDQLYIANGSSLDVWNLNNWQKIRNYNWGGEIMALSGVGNDTLLVGSQTGYIDVCEVEGMHIKRVRILQDVNRWIDDMVVDGNFLYTVSESERCTMVWKLNVYTFKTYSDSIKSSCMAFTEKYILYGLEHGKIHAIRR
jgi:hypothetical protein